MTGAEPVVIENDPLRVTVEPAVGGTITTVEHRLSGLSVLGTVPWDPVTTPDGSFAAPDERRWLTRYTGGWPLLFPNCGGACVVDGVVHGFHGEASIAPWIVVTRTGASLTLRRRFFTVPLSMERQISLDGDVLTVNERVTPNGERPLHVMWGQHVTFGSDLLAGRSFDGRIMPARSPCSEP